MVDENIRLHHEWTLGKPKSEASFAALAGSDAPDRGRDEREAWWCPTCKIGLVWHQVTYEETHDSRYGGCGEPVQPNDKLTDGSAKNQ